MTVLTEQAVLFGPYRVYPRQRLVMDADRPLRLSGRALDILLALLDNAGNVVGKHALISRVWPTTVVEDSNLRVHMAALRKALGDGQAGQRYIVTVAQRGYSFVAPVTLESIQRQPDAGPRNLASHNLPVRRSRLLGREALVERLVAQLQRQRLITLVGPGGIGKTSVALRVAEQLIGQHRDGIRLLDLAALNSPGAITSQLAALLNLSLHDGDSMERLGELLRDRQMLLVIDNCEHMVDAVALLSESILRAAPQVHILATSRESLRAEGEAVHTLDALACPPNQATTPLDALAFPALQLFVERAMAGQESFELTSDNLQLCCEICQRLDGIPLAIELAAAQVGSLGLGLVLEHLHRSLSQPASGQTDAAARHQTLRATLDWSYQTLGACEQNCLRRLSVFRGRFNLESATAVIADRQSATPEVFTAVSQLVSKSLLSVEVGEEDVFYYLLDTTRGYALERLRLHDELTTTQQRHARRCLAIMEQARQDWEHLPNHAWTERYSRSLNDLRAALDWGLEATTPPICAIRLAAHCAPLWQELSLLKEHGQYVRKALALLDANPLPGLDLKMNLKLAQGSFAYHTSGGSAETEDAFATARWLAEQSADLTGQLRATSGLMTVDLCRGNYQSANRHCTDFTRLAQQSGETLCPSTQRLQVLALHYGGDQRQAQLRAEQVLQSMTHNGQQNRFSLGLGVQYDQSVAVLTVLARILWLRGMPDQAWRTARQALDIALQIEHGTSICYTLALAGCPLAIYLGNGQAASEMIDTLREQARKHSVLLFYNWAQRYAQVLAAPAGEADYPRDGGLMNDILATLRPGALSGAGSAALLERARSGAAGWASAEILRRHAIALLETPNPRPAQAEALLLEALEIAKAQDAQAWTLRSATSLAQLWASEGRGERARALLAPVVARFHEGLGTPDVALARRLLDPVH